MAEGVAGGAGAAFFRGGAVGFGAVGAGRCDLFVSGLTDGVRKMFLGLSSDGIWPPRGCGQGAAGGGYGGWGSGWIGG